MVTKTAAETISIDGAIYMIKVKDPVHSVSISKAEAMQQGKPGMGILRKGVVLLVLDGAATCGTFTDEAVCTRVVSCNETIKVGGEEKPTFVQATRWRYLPIHMQVGSTKVKFDLPGYIIPGFG